MLQPDNQESDGLPPIVSMDEFLKQKLGDVVDDGNNDEGAGIDDSSDDPDALRAYVEKVQANWIARLPLPPPPNAGCPGWPEWDE